MEILKFSITHFYDELLGISLLAFIFLLIIIILVWFFYRKKFLRLEHSVPAGLVKGYIDSVIENSLALRSSLLRSDEFSKWREDLKSNKDLHSSSALFSPNVVPLRNLGMSSVLTSQDPQLSQAEISQYQSMLSDRDRTIKELENRLLHQSSADGSNTNQSNIISELMLKKSELENLVQKLKADLENKKGESFDSSSDKNKNDMDNLSRENKRLAEEKLLLEKQLKEYDLIQDDLTQLKKLNAENEHLKQQLKQAGINDPNFQPNIEEDPKIENEELAIEKKSVIQEDPPAENQEILTAANSEPVEIPQNEPKEVIEAETGVMQNKSAEDLLIEFEKMLG